MAPTPKMMLYLLRHGIAKDIAETGIENDADRPLSAQGEEQTRIAAKGFAALNPRVSRIASSPLLRAIQTAEIFASALRFKGDIELHDALASEDGADAVVQWLRGHTDDGLMMVGHMPSLAILASHLACGSHELSAIHFRKSGICRLSCDAAILPGTATLDWLIPPNVLRALAGA